MRRTLAFVPAQLGRIESQLGVRIRNPRTRGIVYKRSEAFEFVAPSIRHGLCQFGTEVAKKQEWCRCGEFFAHEQHRHLGCQQQTHISRSEKTLVGKGVDTVAESAVADHVVVL